MRADYIALCFKYSLFRTSTGDGMAGTYLLMESAWDGVPGPVVRVDIGY
jgi:hypothetical protein